MRLFALALVSIVPGVSGDPVPPAPSFYNQTLDHFDPENAARWKQRYLLSSEHFDGRGRLSDDCAGPILLYTGNEGPIDGFWSGNGFLIDVLAPKWGGLIVFPEERYYGDSLPFGNASFEPRNLRFLTTEQVLADMVELLDAVKRDFDAVACPVVAFGGSYGGTLTTFLRVAHPSAVIGGLASSAPIGYYDPEAWAAHGIDEYTWSNIVERTYNGARHGCVDRIKDIAAAIDASPRSEVADAFNVCEEEGLGSDPSDLFFYAIEGLPQLDYPHPVGDMPAWPVNVACDTLLDASSEEFVSAAAQVTAMGLSYTLDGPCMPTFVEGPGGIPGDGPGPDSWGFQSCTQTLHEFSSHLREYAFEFESSAKEPCQALFGLTPNPNALTRTYGGYKIGDGLLGVSNIIWSNGALDPWSGGGFYPPANAEETGNFYIYMPSGAHHVDLRGPHEDDPADITQAREQEEKIIRGWIDDYAAALARRV